MRTEKDATQSTSQIQTPTGNARTYLRASGFGPKRGILSYPGIRTQIIIYFGVPNRSCESFSYYVYGPSLCLRIITMPTYSHVHMFTYSRSFISDSGN